MPKVKLPLVLMAIRPPPPGVADSPLPPLASSVPDMETEPPSRRIAPPEPAPPLSSCWREVSPPFALILSDRVRTPSPSATNSMAPPPAPPAYTSPPPPPEPPNKWLVKSAELYAWL